MGHSCTLSTRLLTLQTRDAGINGGRKPCFIHLCLKYFLLQRARTEGFFSPFFKKLGVVNKGTEPSAGFPHQKGCAARKEVILTSLVSCAGCRGTFWHIWAFQSCCLRGPRHPHQGPWGNVTPSTGAAGRLVSRLRRHVARAAPLPVLPALPQQVLSPFPGGGSQQLATLDAVCEGPRGLWGSVCSGAKTSR